MRTVLLTGFSPFAGDTRNASWEAVRRLDEARIGEVRVVARQLPTELSLGPSTLLEAIDELAPAAVLCVGQAAGRQAIAIERSFANLIDAPIADNAGWHPRGTEVVLGGPPFLGPTLDVEAAVRAVRAVGIEAYVSDDAGRYVCNTTAYRLAHAVLDRGTIPHGFVHVPGLPGPDRVGMETSEVVRALEAIVATLVA